VVSVLSIVGRQHFEHEVDMGIFFIGAVASARAADAGDSTAPGPRSCGAGRQGGDAEEQSCSGDNI
jgi:hypothetical protein